MMRAVLAVILPAHSGVHQLTALGSVCRSMDGKLFFLLLRTHLAYEACFRSGPRLDLGAGT